MSENKSWTKYISQNREPGKALTPTRLKDFVERESKWFKGKDPYSAEFAAKLLNLTEKYVRWSRGKELRGEELQQFRDDFLHWFNGYLGRRMQGSEEEFDGLKLLGGVFEEVGTGKGGGKGV